MLSEWSRGLLMMVTKVRKGKEVQTMDGGEGEEVIPSAAP